MDSAIYSAILVALFVKQVTIVCIAAGSIKSCFWSTLFLFDFILRMLYTI